MFPRGSALMLLATLVGAAGGCGSPSGGQNPADAAHPSEAGPGNEAGRRRRPRGGPGPTGAFPDARSAEAGDRSPGDAAPPMPDAASNDGSLEDAASADTADGGRGRRCCARARELFGGASSPGAWTDS